jgi:hypothetical protein
MDYRESIARTREILLQLCVRQEGLENGISEMPLCQFASDSKAYVPCV